MIDNFRGFALLLALAAAPLAASDDWPMYLRDPAHSSFNASESRIDRSNVGSLQAAWKTSLSAPIAAAPSVVGGVIYVGAWDGNFHAIDAKTGAPLWRAFVGKAPNPDTPGCQPGIGVTGQAAVVGNVVYVAGGDSAVYALNKATGAQLWRVALDDPTDGAYLWSSLTAYNNALYVGIASLGDCPLVRGALVRIDLANPQRPLFRWMAPQDEVGGGIWSTPAIDAATNTVYVTTGTGDQDPESGTWGGSMLALNATTLEVQSYFLLPTNSVEDDIEWGSSPTLFRTSYGFPMVAATGKDGILYGQSRYDLSSLWRVVLAVSCICPECGCGSLSTPAFDGYNLYVGAGVSPEADHDDGSVYAINPDNGEIIWRRLVPGVVIAPVTVANGILYVSTTDGLLSFEADTGNSLWTAPSAAAIYSQAVVSGGVVYSTQVNGQVVAWQPKAAN